MDELHGNTYDERLEMFNSNLEDYVDYVNEQYNAGKNDSDFGKRYGEFYDRKKAYENSANDRLRGRQRRARKKEGKWLGSEVKALADSVKSNPGLIYDVTSQHLKRSLQNETPAYLPPFDFESLSLKLAHRNGGNIGKVMNYTAHFNGGSFQQGGAVSNRSGSYPYGDGYRAGQNLRHAIFLDAGKAAKETYDKGIAEQDSEIYGLGGYDPGFSARARRDTTDIDPGFVRPLPHKNIWSDGKDHDPGFVKPLSPDNIWSDGKDHDPGFDLPPRGEEEHRYEPLPFPVDSIGSGPKVIPPAPKRDSTKVYGSYELLRRGGVSKNGKGGNIMRYTVYFKDGGLLPRSQRRVYQTGGKASAQDTMQQLYQLTQVAVSGSGQEQQKAMQALGQFVGEAMNGNEQYAQIIQAVFDGAKKGSREMTQIAQVFQSIMQQMQKREFGGRLDYITMLRNGGRPRYRTGGVSRSYQPGDEMEYEGEERTPGFFGRLGSRYKERQQRVAQMHQNLGENAQAFGNKIDDKLNEIGDMTLRDVGNGIVNGVKKGWELYPYPAHKTAEAIKSLGKGKQQASRTPYFIEREQY